MSDKDIKYQIGFSLIPRIGRVRTSQMEMKKVIPVSDAESLLLKYLDAEPTHINEVSRTISLEGRYSVRGDVLLPGSTITTGIGLVIASAILEDDVLLDGDIIIVRKKDNNYNS